MEICSESSAHTSKEEDCKKTKPHDQGIDEDPISSGLFYKAISGSGLQSVDFAVDTQVHRPPGNEPFLRDLPARILATHSLQSFSFRAVDIFARINDVDTEVLGAWTELEHLALYDGFVSEPSIPTNVMHHLHRHCAYLRERFIPRLCCPQIREHSASAPLDRSMPRPFLRLSMEQSYYCPTSTESPPMEVGVGVQARKDGYTSYHGQLAEVADGDSMAEAHL